MSADRKRIADQKSPIQPHFPFTGFFSLAVQSVLLLALAASSLVIGGEDPQVKLATKARLDLMAVESVGELRDFRLVRGDGEVDRMNWISPSDQPRSLTTTIAISPRGWREFALQFTPAGAGTVALHLMGPFEQIDGQIVRQEVLWDALSADGAELVNGGFEKRTGMVLDHWENHGGVAVAASASLPAVEGRYMARTWHNQRLTTALKVTAGRTVVVRGHARAAIPAGLAEMRRIESHDTPAHVAARRFLRGVNLGNYLEAPPGDDWGARYDAEDFKHIKEEGFDHVRLPIGWHHYAGRAPEFTLGRGIFAKVDSLVDAATSQGLGVIINVHHFDAFTARPQGERAKFLALWRQIAEHYAGAKENVAFELLNEPKDAATTEVLNSIYPEAIHLIRQSNPKRTIFVGPGNWNSAEDLHKLVLPDDELNLIVTVHCYAPMYFTHQGAPWTGPDFALTGVRFPGPPEMPLTVPEKARLKPYVLEWMQRYNQLPPEENPSGPRAFAGYLLQAQEWSQYFGRPVHVGEFGCIVKADAVSRAKYCGAIRRQLEEAGIGWALWDWKAGFRYWDTSTNKAVPHMHEALFGTAP